jgi:hypothetical protein
LKYIKNGRRAVFLTMKAVIKSLIILFSITLVIMLTGIRAYTQNYYYIARPVLGIDFEFEYEEETRKGPFITRTDQTTDLTEKLEIKTKGWLYHPALAVYSLAFSPEWEQLREKNSFGQSSITSRSDSNFLEYDAELVVLPYKPYTLTLFGNRKRNELRNNFAGRTIQEETSYGSYLALKSGLLSTSIGYVHTESGSSGIFTGDKNKDHVDITSSNNSKLGSIRLNASYAKSDETLNDIVVDREQQLYSINYGRSFLDNDKVSFQSFLRYADTNNINSSDREGDANGTLFWKHRKNLSTQYTLGYEKRERFDAINTRETDENRALGRFSLNHFLYENFTTVVNAGVIRYRNTGNKELRYDTAVNFHYDRNIPVGEINADMGQKVSVDELNYSSDFTRVIDEPVSLAGTFTFLKNEDIDIPSIIVKDGMGTIYPESGNYVISTIGTLTRIRCIPGGLLDIILDCTAGAPVLIDYDYRSQFPFDYLVHDQSYGVSLNLVEQLHVEMINIYYRFSNSRQYFLKGIRSSTDELYNNQTHLVALALKKKWSETHITYESRRSTTLPLKKTSVKEVITFEPDYYSIMRIALDYTATTYPLKSETEKITNFIVSYEKVISNYAKFSANGYYNKLSSPSQRNEDKGVSVAYDRIYNIYRGKITYTYSQRKDHIVQDTKNNNYILFTLNRAFY